MKRIIAVRVLLVLMGTVWLTPSQAQGAYYAGKTVEIIVPFAAGGGTDIEARFMAPYLEKYLPGNPRVVVRNMPGGGSIIGANWYTDNAKPDGLTIFASSGSTVIPYLLGVPQVRYDYRRWKLVKASGVGDVIYVSPRIGVKSVADLRRPAERFIFGSISPTSVDLAILLVFELLGLDVRSVFGFEGRGPARLAFERGEVTINHDSTPSYLTQVVPMVKDGKAVPIVSLGFLNDRGDVVRDPSAPELPTVYEAYRQLYNRKPDGLLVWKAFRAVLAAGFSFQKTYWVPQETPPELMRILYDTIERIKGDPQFKVESKNVLEGYPLFRGDEVDAAVRRSLNLTLDVRKYMRDLLQTKYNVRNI